MMVIPWVDEQLLASEGGLRLIELVKADSCEHGNETFDSV
jgi:hypothetical protein